MGTALLEAGAPVYHPRYGFGTILRVTRQDFGGLGRGSSAGAAEDYYEINLATSGTLLVPVSRADSVGLRPLTNSLGTIAECLASPPEALPDDGRQRLAGLREREQNREPQALSRAVRDLAALGRRRSLTSAEQKWLDQACRRLSTEAAMLDNIVEASARAAIWEVLERLSALDRA